MTQFEQDMTQFEQTGSIGRRDILRYGLAAGVAFPAMAALSGCASSGGALGGQQAQGGKVSQLVVATSKSPWLGAYKKAAVKYSDESGVKVVVRDFPYGGLRDAMVNAVRGGNQPFDVFQLDEPWTGEFYSNGWCVPLDEVDPKYAWDPQVIDYVSLPRWDAAKRMSTDKGKLYGLPINGNVNVFYYRKDLYDKLGLKVPKTFEQALSNGQRAKDGGHSKYGYVARAQATQGGQSITYDFMPLLYSYGGGWYDSAWKPLINSSGSVEAMNMFKRLLALGPAQPQTVGQAEVISAMQSGQALQCHSVAAAAAQMNDPEKSTVAGKIAFAVMPAGASGSPAPTSGVWSLTIPKGLSKDRSLAAYKFITWMVGKQAELTFTQAGGIPTRHDTLADVRDKPETSYLGTVADSLTYVRPSVRYPFSAEMLTAAEPALAAIASGGQPVKAGLDELAAKLADIAKKAGYGG